MSRQRYPYGQLGPLAVPPYSLSAVTVPSNSSQRRWCCGGFALTSSKSKLRGGLPESREYCFFVLAAYVVAAAALTLLGYSEPKPTYLGIAILMAAAAIMPWIAKEKRRLSSATDSAALKADSAQSALCAYLSLIALVGLGVNAIWHVAWTDPVAALVVVPVIVWEGREAIRGRSCGCC